jgi:conjugal transfer mating pair stabilization protein TraG
MMSNVQHRLSEDPRYGPEAAADYPRFVGSLSGNHSERESSDKAKDFLIDTEIIKS